uniref:Uncharacterized protein n=1 Tax=Arundo donax TaxID=35708 RepID=A0A0A9FNN3_ARUDO
MSACTDAWNMEQVMVNLNSMRNISMVYLYYPIIVTVPYHNHLW